MPIPGDILPGTGGATGASGIIVAEEGAPAGALISGPGQVQFGGMLIADGTALFLKEVVGWRSIATDYADSPLANSHGDRAGGVLAKGLIVTVDCQLRPSILSRQANVDVIEYHTRLRDEPQPLVFDDGARREFRMARVIARELPDSTDARQGADSPSIQFKCADPRRYTLVPRSLRLDAPASVGGLDYSPGLNYSPGLVYGEVTTGQGEARNDGNAVSPVTAVLYGPMINPRLRIGDRAWELQLTLSAGETLTIDGAAGTVLLDGSADRSQALTDSSDLLDWLTIPPGVTPATLTTDGGDGFAALTWHDARM